MKRLSFVALFALALSLGAAGPISFATGDRTAETKSVWDRHVQAAVSGNLDAVMEDFAEESVIVTPDGVIKGKAAIRDFFEAFLGGAKAGAGPVINHEIIHDDIVVFNFSEGGRTFHDTAVIADGKIKVISTVDYPAN
jgi:hypothetical protein